VLKDNQNKTGSMKNLLDSHGFNFSKSMGQNFLIDPNIPKKIVRNSGIDRGSGVLEIGPGVGALTALLSEEAGKVTAVELDTKLLPILSQTLSEHTNVEIVHGDILKLNIPKLINEKMPGLKHCVCANLPYNITTPILTVLIESGVFESITVMVQREVALRMCAKAGTSDYGAFSVFINYHAQPEILFDVPPDCFMPKPKVYSSVIKLTPYTERLLQPDDEARFFSVVKAAFGQRRKTLANALHAVFGQKMSKEEITAIITDCGFDYRIRGETLNIEDFIKISKSF